MTFATSGIKINYVKPVPELREFVANSWLLRNTSDTAQEIIVLPDGSFAISFSYSSKHFAASVVAEGFLIIPTMLSPVR